MYIISISNNYSFLHTEHNPTALQPTEGQGVSTDCWPHFHMPADRRKIIQSA